MNDRLPNLFVEPEPAYRVRIEWPDCTQTFLARGKRNSWQRLSAICHARHFARRNPTCIVHVETA